MKINEEFEYYSEETENSFNFKEYFFKYLKFWPYILICIIVALAGAFMANKFHTPEYKTEAKLMIEEENNNLGVLNLTGMAKNSFRPGGQRLSNESHVLKSKPLASEVLHHLDFDVEYFSEGTFRNTELYRNSPITVVTDWDHPQVMGGTIKIVWNNNRAFKIEFPDKAYTKYNPNGERNEEFEIPTIKRNLHTFGEWVELPFARFKVDLVNKESPGSILVKLRSHNSLVNQYTGEKLQVWPLDATSSMLGLSLVSTVPQKGSDYLNKLMEIFLENELQEKNELASNTVDFIDSQISGVADSLSYIESKLQNFRSNNRTYNIGSEGSAIFSKITELESTISQERFKKEYYQNLQDYLVREDYSQIIMPSGLGIDDPILNRLIEDLILLQSEESRLMASQTASSPAVREVSRKIADRNASIKEVLINVVKNSDMVIRDLEGRLARMDAEFSRLPATEQNLLRIQRSFALNENIYNFLMERRAESAIAMASNTIPDKIIEYSVPSYIPMSLKPKINYVLGLMGGFMVPVIIISLIIFLNVKIKDIKELERKLQVPLLTQIRHNRAKTHLVVLKHSRSGITEAFRSLRTNITFIVPKDKQLTICVTSTIAGEGKTFCSINLASAYALSNKRTVLVGCDLHKPKIFNDFEVQNNLGLSSYLSKQMDNIHSIIQSSQYPNLDLIMAGPTPPNPAELLDSVRFEDMINQLKKEYDVIILDTPPIGLTSETLGILKLVDLTLYVLRFNYSKYVFTKEINELKIKKGFKNIYTVLNDVASKELTYGGYGYGYYQEDNKKRNFLGKLFRSGKAAM